MVAAIKDILQLIKRMKLSSQLHTLSSLSLNPTPIPLALHRQVDIRQINAQIAQLLLTALPTARTLRKKPSVADDNSRVHGKATDLEDILAHSRSIDLPLPTTSRITRPTLLGLRKPRIQPLLRLDSALGNEVRDDVHPLTVPTQDLAPHLIALVSGNLALEAALDGAEHDAHGALDGLAGLGVEDQLCLLVAREVRERGTEEVGDEVGAGDVEVGEVGGVGLVEVVVDLEEGCVRRGDDGLEEGLGGEVGGFAHPGVVEDRVEDAILVEVS